MARGNNFSWHSKPSALASKWEGQVRKVEPGIRTLAQTHAARAEARMKSGAPWTDRTGFARSSLYARAEGTTIYIGTMNAEYGLYLELGTIYMAARPIIEPTTNETAAEYFRDSILLIRGLIGG